MLMFSGSFFAILHGQKKIFEKAIIDCIVCYRMKCIGHHRLSELLRGEMEEP